MNLLLLLAGARIWEASASSAFARTTMAIACLSLEMQVVTLARVGSLRSLAMLNAAVAAACFVWWRPARRHGDGQAGAGPTQAPGLPWPTVALLGGLAVVLAAARTLTGADPYHLERVAQILRLGTLEYDPGAELKANVLASVYELTLADLRQVPAAGPALLQLHGLLSLSYFTLGIAALRRWLPGGRAWCWSSVFLVPVVFHQLVLVKNDLFSTTPALVALAWLVARAAEAPAAEVFALAALAGFAVAIKWVTFPLAVLMAASIAWTRTRRIERLAAVVAGGIAGAVAGGLPFTLLETTRWYGGPFEPLRALGNHTTSIGDAAVSLERFAISLLDFGTVTRRWWPGRGGWGATFGAPLVWAAIVSVVEWRRSPEIRRGVALAVAYGGLFAASYPDADIAHRLVLAPGLLVTAVAAHQTGSDTPTQARLRRLLMVALGISAAQIARSLFEYLTT